nr:transposase [Carbonactinospora thermoautotrophica]
MAEPRRRAEQALTSVVATCSLLGVSTRRLEKLAETLGVTSLSRSQVWRLPAELDAQVEAFRTRPLDPRPLHVLLARRADPEGPPWAGTWWASLC